MSSYVKELRIVSGAWQVLNNTYTYAISGPQFFTGNLGARNASRFFSDFIKVIWCIYIYCPLPILPPSGEVLLPNEFWCQDSEKTELSGFCGFHKLQIKN